MAFTNFESKEINGKVIYFGPRGAGKTENLRSIFSSTSTELRSGNLELGDAPGPTQYFDFLPVSIGHVRDFHLKLHLFTLPPSMLFESLSSIILRGVDGFVFVADSRADRIGENVESLMEAKRLLAAEGYNVADMPCVIQYNKTDIEHIASVEILRQELNPGGCLDYQAVASKSVGTMETLQAMAGLVLKRLAP